MLYLNQLQTVRLIIHTNFEKVAYQALKAVGAQPTSRVPTVE